MSLTKEEIILKTVNIWNENNFQDISLSPVAKALGISKPALYKHFRDKEELIVEIYEYFTAELENIWRLFFNKQKGFSGNILRLLIRYLATYFQEKPECLIFKKNMLVNKMVADKICKLQIGNVLTVEEIDELYDKFEKSGYAIRKTKSFFIYLMTIVETWMVLQSDLIKNRDIKVEKYPKETLVDVCVDQVAEIVESGFFKSNGGKSVDILKIEEEIEKSGDGSELPEDDVFNAIADIIIEDGYWNISVNKIASKLGIVKSSLYNYFKNKKMMIGGSLFKRWENLKKYFKENIFHRDNGFEVWYSLIYFSYRLFSSNLRHAVMMNWIAVKGYKIKEKSQIFDVLVEDYKIKIPENKKLFCGVFCFPLMVVQILVVRYVFFSLLQGMSLDLEEIRNIYNLSVYGIKKGEL